VQSRTGICKCCDTETTIHLGVVVLGTCNLKFCWNKSKIFTTPHKFITGEVLLVEYRDFILICSGHSDIMTWGCSYDLYASVFKAYRGMQWCSWLRHCATSQKAAGSIPDGVIGIFH